MRYLKRVCVIRLKIAMAMLSESMFLSLNAGCLLFLLIFLLSFTLSMIPLVLALTVVLVNIYHILRAIFAAPLDQSRLLKTEGKRDLHRFEQRVKEACDHSMRRAQTRRTDDYCWSKIQVRQSQRIEELRKVPLIEEYKVELSRREVTSCRDEGSSAKKVRTFFQRPISEVDERLNSKIVQAVQREGRLQNKNSAQIGKRINSCLKILLEFLGNKMERDVEAIIEDFEAANRFLSRCFSVTLTLKQPTDQAISPMELLDLVRIIEKKQMIPSRFTSTLTIVQILRELSQVRDRIARLPNFAQGVAVLRMLLAIKHLKKEFPSQAIIFADYSKEQRKEGGTHVVRLQDNGKFYYNSQPHIKSERVEVVLFLLIVRVVKKYMGSSHLARSIYAQLDAKYSFQ